MTTIVSDGGTGLSGYLDTLAQSFFIERNLHVTKIDLFFNSKDDQSSVELCIRPLQNGLPSDAVVPGSRVVKQASEIAVSSNSNVATSFVFNTPIYLETGQYCFSLFSQARGNRVYISELAKNDINTGSVISKNPYSGILYASSNGVTWDSKQNQDIKFKLFRANILSSTATIDFVAEKFFPSGATFKLLENNPFKSYNGKSTVKVFHNNHGFSDGATVVFTGLPGQFELASNANAVISFNGVPYEKINNVNFVVSNVTSDTYTIPLATTSGETANVVEGRFGGVSVLASSYTPYTTIYPAISSTAPPNTQIRNFIKTTDSSLNLSGFEPINADTVEFTDTKVIVDPLNRSLSMGGQQSFVYRVELSSNDSYVSPVIDLAMTSVLFVSPDVNNASPVFNLVDDLVTITSANTTISFANNGVVTTSDPTIQANIRTMRPGAFVTISGAGEPSNNGTFRLTAVDLTGNTFSIPAANTEPTGNVVTIVYRPEFISELAATGGSNKAKYITRKIQLATPSTALLLRFALSKPIGSDVDVYYKTSSSEEASVFAAKEFTQLDIGTIPSTVVGQYVDIERFVEDLPAFDELIVKIVLRTTERARYPRVKDLRIIALE